jgi:hypothetical protein
MAKASRSLVVRAVGPLAAVVAIALLSAACREESPPDYPPQQPPIYGQPDYNMPPAGGNQPGGNPMGLPCRADGGICGGHRCNLAAQRCAFPCIGAQDCMPGFGCAAGVCVIGMPRQ